MADVAAAQKALDDFKAGHDAYIADLQPASEYIDPGWKRKAEDAYSNQVRALQHEVDYQQSQARLATNDAAALPKVTAQGADATALTAERTANQAKGLGYITNAEAASQNIATQRLGLAGQQVDIANGRLGLAQQNTDIASQRLGLSEQNAALVARQAQIRDDLAQHKIEYTAAMDQLREIQVEQQALVRDQTNQVNLYGHQVTEHGQEQTAATADQTAADTLIDSQKLMPAGAITNGGGFNIKANAVPLSQYSDMATYIANQVANARAARVGPAPVAPTLPPYTAPALPVIPSAVTTVTPPTAPQFTAPATYGRPQITAPNPSTPSAEQADGTYIGGR